MPVSRNPQGNPHTLVKAALAKKEDATERLEKAIKKVVDSGETITFRAVAETAGLSVSYLYKYPEIKNKIAHLRSQQQLEVGEIVNNAPQFQPASDKSKAVLLSKLREENRGLRAENEGLRKHIEVVQGRVVELRHVEAENTRLKQRLEELSSALQEVKVTPINSKRTDKLAINDQIRNELEELKIPLNSILTKTIKSASVEIVLSAIEALKEAMATGEIKNPGGWLNTAIKDGWEPYGKNLPMDLALRDIFKEWFDLARKQRLVLASTKGSDGQMYVYNMDGAEVPFEQMLAEYPLEKLRTSL